MRLRLRMRAWSGCWERGLRACSSVRWRVGAIAALPAPRSGLDAFPAGSHKDEDRAEGEQRQHERCPAVYTDRHEPEPDKESEPQRPEEGRHPAIDTGRPEMHRRSNLTGPKKIRRAGFAFVHRFR